MRMAAGKSLATVDAPFIGKAACAPTRKDPDRLSCCVHIDGPPPNRPDLAIYSQDEQFASNVVPTWDNPDILTNRWTPFGLYPETSVAVRNLSAVASAVNAQVSLFTSAFGLGMPRSLLSSQTITLAPGQASTLLFPLSQAILLAGDQRIGTYVSIVHPYDMRPINNAGAQLLADAYTSARGRSFGVTFPVMNPQAAGQQLTLSALPNQLNAIVAPATRLYAPFEQIVATLAIEVPAAVHGSAAAPVRSDVSIVARDADGAVIGGLTYVIWIDT
jgi:hypothetical protein